MGGDYDCSSPLLQGEVGRGRFYKPPQSPFRKGGSYDVIPEVLIGNPVFNNDPVLLTPSPLVGEGWGEGVVFHLPTIHPVEGGSIDVGWAEKRSPTSYWR